MIIIDCIQGSQEWKQARCGHVTASRIADLTAKTKTGYGASRGHYLAEIITEVLTGEPYESGYTNDAMRRGTEKEPAARELYGFIHGVSVVQVGVVRHPKISRALASPDGLVGDDGLVELKAPTTKTHLENLRRDGPDPDYLKQCMWQLACTGRYWVDLVSFDDRVPTEMQMVVNRIHRDDKLIAELEAEVVKFLAEVDATVAELRAKYGMLEAA